jgi:branched-chain amino acid transport system permease protein
VPRESINLLMDLSIIADAFVVVVIGGMGVNPRCVRGRPADRRAQRLRGACAAAGHHRAAFVVMAVVLIIRPYGLFGKARERRPCRRPC